MHKIITTFTRPANDLIAEVSKQHVGVAGFETGPRQIMHSSIKPLNEDWRICGPAFTVQSHFWDDRLCSELAPKYAQAGDVLIVDAGGNTEVGVWGMSMSANAKLAGIEGVVIDGSTMNKALLANERPQIPIFSRGVSPSAKNNADGPGSINIPVICGGVIVYPGDIILGDADGVVVLKPEQAQRIIENAQTHDIGARAAVKKNTPYYQQKDSEAKLREFENIVWQNQEELESD